MKTFQFSIRVYVKGTRITPFIMPKYGIYRCNWTEAGICNFEGIENGYTELFARLDDYFHMDQPLEVDLIQYYDRLAETLMRIGSQGDFETALLHSSQTYSPFSLVIKVNAPRRDEHWYNGDSEIANESVAFGTAWRISKPKFTCIREWLINLQENGQVCQDISNSISYAEKAFLYAQFRRPNQGQGSINCTNHIESFPKMNQSNSPKTALFPIKPSDLELLDASSPSQKMLHDKMMMDPAISIILFNEYIPLRLPPKGAKKTETEEEKITSEMGGLFLGKLDQPEEVKSALEDNKQTQPSGLFIRSEGGGNTSTGLFIRSEDSVSTETDDWVIA